MSNNTKKIPDLLSQLEFTTSPEYHNIIFHMEDTEMTIIMDTLEGDDISVLTPQQAVSLAYEILKNYREISLTNTIEGDNIVKVNFNNKTVH